VSVGEHELMAKQQEKEKEKIFSSVISAPSPLLLSTKYGYVTTFLYNFFRWINV